MSSTVEEERLLTGYSGRIVILALVGTIAAFVGRNIFGPLLPAIIEDLGITSSEAGVALTIMWVAIAITQYPGGRAADQLSYKTILVASLCLLTAGFGFLVVTSTYIGFIFSLIIMGLGAGAFTPSVYAQLAALFEERRGQAFGLYTSSIDIGSAGSGAVAIGALAVATWRMSFAPVAIAISIVIIAMHFVHRGEYVLNVLDVRLELRKTADRLLGDPAIRWALVSYFTLNFVFIGVLGFLPAYLQFSKGLSSTLANNVFIAFFILGAGVRVLSGYLGDRMRHLTVAAGSAIIGATGLLIMYAADSLIVLAFGTALLAAGLTGYPPVMNAYLMDRFEDTSMGGDFGASRTLLILLASVGTSYVGFLADEISYTIAFIALVPFFIVNALIVLWLRRWV